MLVPALLAAALSLSSAQAEERGWEFRLDAEGNTSEEDGESFASIKWREPLSFSGIDAVFSSALVDQTVYDRFAPVPQLSGRRQGTYLENRLIIGDGDASVGLDLLYTIVRYTGPDAPDAEYDDAFVGMIDFGVGSIGETSYRMFTEYSVTGKDFRRQEDIRLEDFSDSEYTRRGTEQWSFGVVAESGPLDTSLAYTILHGLTARARGFESGQTETGIDLDLVYTSPTAPGDNVFAPDTTYASFEINEVEVPGGSGTDDQYWTVSLGSYWTTETGGLAFDYEFYHYDNRQSGTQSEDASYQTFDISYDYSPSDLWWAYSYLSIDISEDDSSSFPFSQTEVDTGLEVGFRIDRFPDLFGGVEYYNLDARYLSGADGYDFDREDVTLYAGLDLSKFIPAADGYRSRLRIGFEKTFSTEFDGSRQSDRRELSDDFGLRLEAVYLPR
ncbi:hypothetical protein [Tropicimonas aquimaris]|uniref:Outer membrane beta-barrel protein n=1 Tax=Tropicimonas aquimaris TaxID=914152 RepID=A0ABW3IRM6_9RHOB